MATKKKETTPSVLLNNEPHDIGTNDLFGTLPKAKAIKDFLEAYHDQLGNNKMFALYGEWGTGKSSILKYLDKNLTSEKFETIFFETWENEKDDNLPLSLAYMLAEKAMRKRSKQSKNVTEFKRASGVFLKCFLKGVAVKFKGVVVDVEVKGGDMITALDKEAKEEIENISFTQQLNQFKGAFKNLEDEILGDDSNKRLVVFVDDLDRCETENVLTLISAMKLFFTYGERTLFFCGVDKNAVMNALKTKYHDIIKAEEYLEKVFDINWTMPQSYYPVGLIKSSFPTLDSNDCNFICQMFSHLEFTNARHLKKVLNKYELLRLSNESKSDQSLIPYILDRKGNGDIICTVLVLFFIALYEFHRNEFQELEQYDIKRATYERSVEDHMIHQGHDASKLGSHKQIIGIHVLLDHPYALNVSSLINGVVTRNDSNYEQLKHASIFFPRNGLKEVSANPFETLSQFPNHYLGVKFCRFIIGKADRFSKTESKYPIWKLFQMCKTLL